MDILAWTKSHLRLLTGLVVLAAAIWALQGALDVPSALKWLLDRIRATGTLAPLLFILVYVAATVLFLPGSVLTLGAGVLFGVLWGSVLVSIAATLGATAAFLVGRHLARSRMESRIQGNPTFDAIDRAVAREGWQIVLLTRLSPVFPYNFLNYAFGLTRVSLGGYVLASWIGMLPGTVMYVYIGALIGSLALIGTQARSRTPAEWLFYALGLIATIGVTVKVTRLARRALAKKVPPDAPGRGGDQGKA